MSTGNISEDICRKRFEALLKSVVVADVSNGEDLFYAAILRHLDGAADELMTLYSVIGSFQQLLLKRN